MGNEASIPDDIAARFAMCELESIRTQFQKLADETSFRKKYFDKKTFQKYFFTSYPSISDLLFNAFDATGNGKVEFEAFVRGLVLIRGSFDEQLIFIWKMFRLKKGKSVSIDEFRTVTSSGIFAGTKETKDAKKNRVKFLAAEVYKEYDKDRDRALNRKEFTEWARQSLEATVLLDLFKKLDNLVVSTGSEISGPTNVVHDTHVSKTEGGFSIDNIPPSWLELFIGAGVTKQELEDPKTAMMLMEIVADKISNNTRNEATQPPVETYTEPVTTSNNVPQPVVTPVQNNQPTYQPQPQAPTRKQPEVPQKTTTAPPTAPTPPPLNMPAPPALSGIKTTGPPKLENRPLSPSTEGLLSQIRQGTSLKKVEDSTGLQNLSNDDKNDLTNVLARAINKHRQNLKIEDDGSDDEWDD